MIWSIPNTEGRRIHLERAHSSTLPWKIPQTEEPDGLQSRGFIIGLPRWLNAKESACQHRRLRFYPWVGKIPWRRKWQPTPVFLPGESHGRRSLVGYSPRGRKELDTTECLN